MTKAYSIILFLVLPLTLTAQDWKTLSVDDAQIASLRTALAKMESIKGDIHQEKAFAFLTEKLVSKGSFVYLKESNLRWEFNDPIEYIILISENSMRLKEEGEEKKYKGMNQILRQVKEIILGCIDGSIMDNSNYKTNFSTDNSNIRIQLQPKERKLKEFIQQIDVQFSNGESILQEVILTDPSGDQTEIRFSNISVNTKINEAVFADF